MINCPTKTRNQNRYLHYYNPDKKKSDKINIMYIITMKYEE